MNTNTSEDWSHLDFQERVDGKEIFLLQRQVRNECGFRSARIRKRHHPLEGKAPPGRGRWGKVLMAGTTPPSKMKQAERTGLLRTPDPQKHLSPKSRMQARPVENYSGVSLETLTARCDSRCKLSDSHFPGYSWPVGTGGRPGVCKGSLS